MNPQPVVVGIGECMIELVRRPDDLLRPSYAGDVFNTLVYLRRSAENVSTHFVSAVGRDQLSDDLVARAAEEGLGTATIWRHPTRTIGLYLVHTDDQGERSFTYFRDRSAARDCFAEQFPSAITAAVETADLVYLSGITVSILSAAGREQMLAVVRRARAGGARIAFDLNYRPRGWVSPRATRTALTPFLATVDIALTSWEDEHTLWGDLDPAATARRYGEHGATEVVVKQGSGDVLIAEAQRTERLMPVEIVEKPLDTTGAGDSFNGAYLAARLTGGDAYSAAGCGALCAAEVIQHQGAIIPRRSAVAQRH